MTNLLQKSATVTLERTGYEELMAKASLLDDIFEHLPEFALPAELYRKPGPLKQYLILKS